MAPSHLHTQTLTWGLRAGNGSPWGVQSNFISPHMQDEVGHPQSSSTHGPLLTRLQSHVGSITRETLAMPFQGWLHLTQHHRACTKKELSSRGTITHGDRVSWTGWVLTRRKTYHHTQDTVSNAMITAPKQAFTQVIHSLKIQAHRHPNRATLSPNLKQSHIL